MGSVPTATIATQARTIRNGSDILLQLIASANKQLHTCHMPLSNTCKLSQANLHTQTPALLGARCQAPGAKCQALGPVSKACAKGT